MTLTTGSRERPASCSSAIDRVRLRLAERAAEKLRVLRVAGDRPAVDPPEPGDHPVAGLGERPDPASRGPTERITSSEPASQSSSRRSQRAAGLLRRLGLQGPRDPRRAAHVPHPCPPLGYVMSVESRSQGERSGCPQCGQTAASPPSSRRLRGAPDATCRRRRAARAARASGRRPRVSPRSPGAATAAARRCSSGARRT